MANVFHVENSWKSFLEKKLEKLDFGIRFVYSSKELHLQDCILNEYLVGWVISLKVMGYRLTIHFMWMFRRRGYLRVIRTSPRPHVVGVRAIRPQKTGTSVPRRLSAQPIRFIDFFIPDIAYRCLCQWSFSPRLSFAPDPTLLCVLKRNSVSLCLKLGPEISGVDCSTSSIYLLYYFTSTRTKYLATVVCRRGSFSDAVFPYLRSKRQRRHYLVGKMDHIFLEITEIPWRFCNTKCFEKCSWPFYSIGLMLRLQLLSCRSPYVKSAPSVIRLRNIIEKILWVEK